MGGNARHPPRAPPLATKPRPRAQLGPVHAWTARTRAQRPLRSATMLAVLHWLGFGGRNTSEGAGTESSGGALGVLADAASGGACFCAACAELADRVAAAWARSNGWRVITRRPKFHVITRCDDDAARVMFNITRATSRSAPVRVPHARATPPLSLGSCASQPRSYHGVSNSPGAARAQDKRALYRQLNKGDSISGTL